MTASGNDEVPRDVGRRWLDRISPRAAFPGEGGANGAMCLLDSSPPTASLDDQHERGLLVGERLHRQVDAEDLLRVVDSDTSFRSATRISPG